MVGFDRNVDASAQCLIVYPLLVVCWLFLDLTLKEANTELHGILSYHTEFSLGSHLFL